MLRYVGHPFVDVGAATIAALVGKVDPSTLNEGDLDRVADFIAREYVVDPLKSFLNVAFPNSGYTNPAFENRPEKRGEYADRVLRGYRLSTPRTESRCVFTGQPATAIAFSDKLPPGRGFRQHIPLTMGEGYINFYPWGDAGLPVSGEALLCIQAFPLGCAKCGGKLLAVHSDNPDVTYDFASEFLRRNRSALLIAHAEKSKKMPEARTSPKTLLIETLVNLEQRRQDERRERRPCSVTAYYLTNSGQSNPLDPRNPPLEIYHLPTELTAFLGSIVTPEYKEEWSAIVARAWRLSTQKKNASKNGEKGGLAEEDDRPKRNLLYEDLFQLPTGFPSFVRRYLLRLPVRSRAEDDPRRNYSLRDEAHLVSWSLTQLLLAKVVRMDSQRIEQIRMMGDRLAQYVAEENDKRFFSSFFAEQNYGNFRNNLIRANVAHVRRGNPPLITLDPYIEVFEEGDEVASPDWKLARDLVLIRMVERLHERGWLAKNREAIPEFSGEAMPQ